MITLYRVHRTVFSKRVTTWVDSVLEQVSSKIKVVKKRVPRVSELDMRWMNYQQTCAGMSLVMCGLSDLDQLTT
jgi:hypothetical protein